MKILFHINSMGHGGAERVVSILSKNFANQGHEVIVATQWQSQREYPLAPNIKRVSVGLTAQDEKKSRLYKAGSRLFRLRKCIKNEKPDLVISFCCKANFRSAFSLLGMKVPLLVSVRNNPVEDYAQNKLATWYMEKKAAGCVFQTSEAKAYFSKKFQEKSKIIFNPLSDIYYTKEEIEKENQPIVRKQEIVSVGRITAQKNQLLLLKAFASISDKYPNYILKLYGTVENQDIYEDMLTFIKQHEIQARVKFMGNTDDIPNEIRSAAMFVLSSDYEGMPNALIEAMVLGIPCISTDCPCGGPAMLIQDKKSGLLIPVGDVQALSHAMEYILSDASRAEAMGQMGKLIKDKVNPENICEEWLAYIKEIV